MASLLTDPWSAVAPLPGSSSAERLPTEVRLAVTEIAGAAGAWCPALSPEGDRIAYVTDRSGLPRLEVATLDQISGGRVLFGVGGGWNRVEMANHGTDPATRWRLLRERVLACKEIWTKEEAEFHGEFVDFGPLWSWPKPSKVPKPLKEPVTSSLSALSTASAWTAALAPAPRSLTQTNRPFASSFCR